MGEPVCYIICNRCKEVIANTAARGINLKIGKGRYVRTFVCAAGCRKRKRK